MPNLRIVYDNALERAATFTASSTAGALAVTNLTQASKASVHRSAGATPLVQSYNATWAVAEPIGCVALPYCNLSPTALWRIRASSEAATTNFVRYSEQFNNAVWNLGTGAIIDVSTVVAPDGTTTAEAYTHPTSTTNYAYLSQTIAGTQDASLAWTYSLWVKVPSGTATLALCISSVSGATASTVSSAAQIVTTTWQRLRFTIAAGQLANTGVLGVGVSGTAGKVYHVWGAQLEQGLSVTSYYPTTASAATRPAGYIDSWQSYNYDSGFVLTCPAPAVKLRGFTPAQAASAYTYGGGACARHWLPAEIQARGLVVEISDPNNLQGYIEAACIVAGPVWSPQYNASDATMTPVDTSKHERTAAGSLVTDPGFIYRKVPIELSYMTPADREKFAGMLRSSQAYPIFVSVFPGSSDLALERDYTVYGKRSQDSAIAIKYASAYSTTLYVEEL